jgi:hypothetical protein
MPMLDRPAGFSGSETSDIISGLIDVLGPICAYMNDAGMDLVCSKLRESRLKCQPRVALQIQEPQGHA